jgi:hypothetical protein
MPRGDNQPPRGGFLCDRQRLEGVVEHDCIDCGKSWDLQGETHDYCIKCGSYNIEVRPAPVFERRDPRPPNETDSGFVEYPLHLYGYE